MKWFLLYLAVGIAVYCALLVLFRRSGLKREGLNSLWWWWLGSGEPLALLVAPLLWPLVTLLSILEYWHLASKRRDAERKAIAERTADKYSHMSMDELLAAQKKAGSELAQEPQGKEDQTT